MKKKLTIIFIMILGCSMYSYLSNKSKQKLNISELMLSNVDALAEGETYYKYKCYGTGSVDCPNGSKVACVAWPLSFLETE